MWAGPTRRAHSLEDRVAAWSPCSRSLQPQKRTLKSKTCCQVGNVFTTRKESGGAASEMQDWEVLSLASLQGARHLSTGFF